MQAFEPIKSVAIVSRGRLTFRRHAIRAFAAALFMFIAADAAAAEVVVIASNVPGLAAGQIVDGTQPLVMVEGQRLTVVTGQGQTLTRSGPFKGYVADAAAPADKGLLTALSALASGPAAGKVALGGVRGLPNASPTNPWAVAVDRAGDHCVLDGAPVRLWRSAAGNAQPFTLMGAKDEGQATVQWPGGSDTLTWPEGVRIVDGAVYFARFGTASSAKRLVLHVVPADLPSDAHRAARMGQHGCRLQGQAVLLVLGG
jgi:hypothetical protein